MALINLVIIGLDNDMVPVRRQPITRTESHPFPIFLTINFSKTRIKIHTFSWKGMQLKISFVTCLDARVEYD